jgi:multiple sugar transport system permease protein
MRLFSHRHRKHIFWGLFFVSPWIFGFVVFNLLPMLLAFSYSFTNLNLIKPDEVENIGFKNYKNLTTLRIVEADEEETYRTELLEDRLIPQQPFELFGKQYAIGLSDPLFWKSTLNTLYIVGIGLPLQIFCAFLIAYLLSKNSPLVGLFRAVVYLPTLIPPVTMAVIWQLVLNPRFGPLDSFLEKLGIPGPNWVLDPAWTKPAIVIITIWSLGGSMLILMAAIMNVPRDYYESAQLDGANWLQQSVKITLPLTSPAILFVTITGIIFSFQTFTIPYVYAGPSGQPADSLLFYAMHIYNNAIELNRMGRASAMGVILFIITFLLTIIILRTSRRMVFYRS